MPRALRAAMARCPWLALLVLLCVATSPPRVLAQAREAAPTEPAATPALGTHPDEGLMIAGGSLFLLALTVGVTVLMPVEMSGCIPPGGGADLPPDS